MTETSLRPILLDRPGISISLLRAEVLTSTMETAARFIALRRCDTAASLGASMRAFWRRPCESRTVYSKVFVAAIPQPPALDRASGGGRALGHARATTGESVELLHMVALLEAGLIRDAADADKVGQMLVHGVHALLGTGLHRGVDLVRLAFPDEIADRGGRDHDLRGDGAAGAVGAAAQGLAHDALERVRELRAHLALLIRREDVDDAVD